ncbi:MAG: hypothetical protein K2K37_03950, partial [Muribaculaceae bacterium]|nr:hypothetical protein [Muribaculaceae bacterium]
KQDIEIQATVDVQTRKETPNNDAKKLGCDWTNETFSDIKVRFLLDRDRNIYSKPFYPKNTSVDPTINMEMIIAVYADMTDREYSNLMVELSFSRKVDTIISNYVMRQHFNRPVPADMLSYGNSAVVPKKRGKVEIAKFTISKVDVDAFQELSSQKNIEAPTVTTDIAKPASRTLSDYCGNMYNPVGPGTLYPEYIATKLQHIGNNNVRAYMTIMPSVAFWKEGDEIVVTTATGRNLYVLFDGSWRKLY